MLFFFCLSFIIFSLIAVEVGGGVFVRVGERGGVAGGVGQAVTAVHTGFNRKE